MSSIAIRSGEELPIGALTEYLRGKIEGVETGLIVEQFREGHSNLTYHLMCANGREYVLRRPPVGPTAPKAHDMVREYRFLQAVHHHFPEAPRPCHLCEDTAVLGVVFFVMECRPGIILRHTLPPEFLQIPDHPLRISEAFLSCLVRLHAIDVADPALAALGKPQGFLERQVQGWSERWNRARTQDVPEMDLVGGWLAGNLPCSPPAALIHNDYKLDNVVFRSVDEVEAVLDWEMATIGDPLADFGLALCYWTWVEAPGVRGPVASLTSGRGWHGRQELIARYAEQTGRDLSRIVYYEVLGIYKLAVVLQQIYHRFWCGQTRDERFQNFNQRAASLAHLAASVVEKQG